MQNRWETLWGHVAWFGRYGKAQPSEVLRMPLHHRLEYNRALQELGAAEKAESEKK